MNTVNAISRAFGPPRLIREVRTGARLDATIGRWRHQGARADLSGGDRFQLVFNVSGGQRVELQRSPRATGGVMRAGSLGVVEPDKASTVAVIGRADTLQIFLTRPFVEAIRRDAAAVPNLANHAPSAPELQAAAVQVLVALTRPDRADTAQLRRALQTVALYFVMPSPRASARGGLSPASARRVDALIAERLGETSIKLPTVGELADACGLGPHHFIRAFRQSRGRTPHAHMADRRLDTALALLLEDTRVDETADTLGFCSPSHFISAFRARMGVTPGALREAAGLGPA